MNKQSIAQVAAKARETLTKQVELRAFKLGFRPEQSPQLPPQQGSSYIFGAGPQAETVVVALHQRLAQRLATNFAAAIDEAAYTWFNRMVALRYMELTGLLPSGVRVLSSVDPQRREPDLLREYKRAALEVDEATIQAWQRDNNDPAIYRYLFIKQCNALAGSMPFIFEAIDDVSELLLPDNLLAEGSAIAELVNKIPAEDFADIEICGWIYQYYISEKKNEVYANLKKNVKVKKEDIPAATQLFTPEWIVRYMVENSLGRMWLEGHPTSKLAEKMSYYLKSAPQEPEVEVRLAALAPKGLKPEAITFLDPCCGSGHILVYAFDVFYALYLEMGYMPSDIPRLILQHNLYGLDIDRRAAQLASFAVLMKAASYDRTIVRSGIVPRICSITESNGLDLEDFPSLWQQGDKDQTAHRQQLQATLTCFKGAGNFGSLITPPDIDYPWFAKAITAAMEQVKGLLTNEKFSLERLGDLVQQSRLLAESYDIVVTNPPYMGSGNMNPLLAEYLKSNYPNAKSDLFAAFMERCQKNTKQNAFFAMITQHAWMFLSSYEKLRKELLQIDTVNMVHLGPRAFEEIGGEVVQSTAFVMRKSNTPDFKASYVRLTDFNNAQEKETKYLETIEWLNSPEVKGGMASQQQKTLEAAEALRANSPFPLLHYALKDNFTKIPGAPIAYWVSAKFINAFALGTRLKNTGDTRQGMATSDNNRFLRQWYEVSYLKLGFNYKKAEDALNSKMKWFPYNKGGEFRKWYGNADYVINYERDGYDVKQYAISLYKSPTRTIKSISEYFKESISWSKISSGSIAFRYYPEGFIFDVAGCCIFFTDKSKQRYVFAFLNTIVCKKILDALSPTLNYEAGHIASTPIIENEAHKATVDCIVDINIKTSKMDWDNFETSWEFKGHPLV